MSESALRNVIKQLILELRGDQEPQPEISNTEFKVSVDKDYPGSHNPMIDAGISEYKSNLDFIFSSNPEYVLQTRYYVRSGRSEGGDGRDTSGNYHGGYSHALRHGAEVDKEGFDKFLRGIERGCISRFKNGTAHLCQHKKSIGDGKLVAIYSTNSSLLDEIEKRNPRVKCFELSEQDVDSFFQSGPSADMSQNISFMRGPVEEPIYSLGTIANTLDRANDIYMGNDEGDFEEESFLSSSWNQFIGKKGFYQKNFIKAMKALGENVKFVTDDVFKSSLLNSIKSTVALNPVVVGRTTNLQTKINMQGNEIEAYCIKIPDPSDAELAAISIPQGCIKVDLNEDVYIVGPQAAINSFSRYVMEIGRTRAVARIIEDSIVPAVNEVLLGYKSRGEKIAYIVKGAGYLMPIFNLVTGQFMILVNQRKQSSGWVPLTFMASKGGGKIGRPDSPQQMILDLSEAEVWGKSPDYSIILSYIRTLLDPESKYYTSITSAAERDFKDMLLAEKDFETQLMRCLRSEFLEDEEIEMVINTSEIQNVVSQEPEPDPEIETTPENQDADTTFEQEPATSMTPDPVFVAPKRRKSRLRAHLDAKKGA